MGNDAGMKYTSAYLLCAMGGVEPTKAAIVKIFESAGVSYEAALIDLVFKKMDGRDLQETIKNGLGNLESTGGGGGGGGGGAAAGGAAAGGAAAGGAVEKAAAPVEEEEAEEMEFDLFD